MDASKERFPWDKFRKLKPKADGLFKVLKRIGKNSYKIELPENYRISPIFNIADLIPFHNHVDETNMDLRTSLFQPGEIDILVSNLLQFAYMDLANDMVFFSANNVAS